MSESQTVKKNSAVQTIVVSGTISILIVIAGTAGFLRLQDDLLKKAEIKQACYLDLVDLRGALIEYSFTSKLNNPPGGSSEKQAAALLLGYEELAFRMRSAGMNHPLPLPGPAGKKAGFSMREIENTIEKTKSELREASEELVRLNQLFLFLMLSVLLTLSITAVWRLNCNYRHTIIPLARIADQLKMVNSKLPESIHDTGEEMKKELTESEHSDEITQITESIMGFCDEIEAKNKKLDEIHIRDEKTNLYNYRHFKEHLIIEVERAGRFGDKLSLAMIDIDHFKRYNDANGHIAGDRVLKILADIISSQSRTSDVPSRFGGEEFALLFPKTDAATARDIAERLRKTISAEQFIHEEDQPSSHLTVSIGIATFPDDAADRHILIKNADRALYSAKSASRNNVVTFASMNLQNSEPA